MRVRVTAIAAALSCLLAACGDDDPQTAAPAPAAETPSATPGAQSSSGAGATYPYIGSLAVDPGDGTLTIGTGLGLFQLDRGASKAKPAEGQLTVDQGSGAISPNLVLRYVAPGELLASGHPKDGSSPLPEDLGLIRSQDGGETWSAVSLLGEADLHGLDARDDRVVGQPVEEQRLLVSRDGGRSFEESTPPGLPIDLDLDPANPDRVALTTSDGVYISEDSGATWRQRDVLSVEAHLAWAPSGTLYRVEADGSVKASDDAGESWEPRGNAGGSPSTATVDPDGALYVALAGAAIVRSDDGARSFEQLTQIEL